MTRTPPRVGLGVFVLNANDEFLMGFRESRHGHGTWSLPGGHLEHGESFAEASQREVIEETGVEVGALRVATVTNDLFADSQRHYVTIWMVGEYLDGEPTVREPDKFTRLRWVTADTLPHPVFPPFADLLKNRELPGLLHPSTGSDQAALPEQM
ncbi:MAG TPA: NUDIX domain-containing protein [Actinoplanes sp.]|nr:NUDIX domain-containing protein [Actinoplanes sp.]